MSKKREAPEIGTSEFLPTTKDDRVILGKTETDFFLEEDASDLVPKFTNSHQVVLEVRHYVAAHDWELREEHVT